MVRNKKMQRTWVHLDSGFVFAEAPHPQEGLGWLLQTLGPEGAAGDRHWSGTLTFSGMPVHKSQYEKLIASSSLRSVGSLLFSIDHANHSREEPSDEQVARTPHDFATQLFKGNCRVGRNCRSTQWLCCADRTGRFVNRPG